MRALYTSDGDIPMFDDDMGSPQIKAGRYFIPLLPSSHKNASKIRVLKRDGHSLALAKDGIFNFNRILVRPYRRGDDIVFPRANGDILFTLSIARGD